MVEKLLIIDTGVIRNLHAAGGEQAWGELLKAGTRVVVPKDILKELNGTGLRLDFEDWIARNGSSKVFVPDYDFSPPAPSTYTGDIGDDAIRSLTANTDPDVRAALNQFGAGDGDFRILTDDGSFFRQMKTNDGFDKAALAARGQYKMPYHGSFEFLAERLANGDISKSEYKVLRENFESSTRFSSLDAKPGSNFRGQIMNDGTNTSYGGDGSDSFYAYAGTNLIFGDDGGDIVRLLGGSNTAYGGEGGDTFYGSGGANLIFGGEGGDTVYADGGQNSIFGGLGGDFIYGGAGDDVNDNSAVNFEDAA